MHNSDDENEAIVGYFRGNNFQFCWRRITKVDIFEISEKNKNIFKDLNDLKIVRKRIAKKNISTRKSKFAKKKWDSRKKSKFRSLYIFLQSFNKNRSTFTIFHGPKSVEAPGCATVR